MDEPTSLRIPPSGAQHRLTWEAQEATVVEVGGGVREYRVADVPVLDGYSEDEQCPGAAGTVLAPWPNRIRGGRYTFNGRTLQLPINETASGNAIHGLARWQSWNARRRGGPAEVELSTAVHPQPGYPFSVLLTVRWSLGPEGLHAAHAAVNTGTVPCPFGLGVHPYLCVPGEPVDALLLRLSATHVFETDEAGLPVSTQPVAGTEQDFHGARRIGGAQIDAAFAGLQRDQNGRARVEVRGPGGGGAMLWMDRSFPYAQLYTGDTLDPPRRRRAIAVEPMTCPADAFRSGEGLVVLAPGETWRGSWGVTPR